MFGARWKVLKTFCIISANTQPSSGENSNMTATFTPRAVYEWASVQGEDANCLGTKVISPALLTLAALSCHFR
ncbi:hypothetical protein E2C01_031489 [Portunus trituberculatus]|uniref:Uncharacterized protein n=1 Tax=Portunus trituberculatus TaxID=210409 RepID=A0A5B7EYQ1_PORTR|nr:hypothetical protein [Portunus trituberculatus]